MTFGTLARGALAAAWLCSSLAQAATQGVTGSTSVGSLMISVGIHDRIKISNLRDISGTFDGVNDFVGSSPVCVYRNGSGVYSVVARGGGSGGAFELSDSVNRLPFVVSFDDGSGPQPVSPGRVLSQRRGADRTSPICENTGNNGEVSVRISARTLSSVPASTYAGVLTLIVSPE